MDTSEQTPTSSTAFNPGRRFSIPRQATFRVGIEEESEPSSREPSPIQKEPDDSKTKVEPENMNKKEEPVNLTKEEEGENLKKKEEEENLKKREEEENLKNMEERESSKKKEETVTEKEEAEPKIIPNPPNLTETGVEENQKSILKSSNARRILEKHRSFEHNREGRVMPSASMDEAIEKYYERNQMTISDRNQTTFNRLPEYMRRARVASIAAGSHKSVHSMGRVSYTAPLPVERDFAQSFYWKLLHNHKNYGFRHIVFLIIVAIYTLFGAAVFYYLESHHERSQVESRKQHLEDTLDHIAEEMTSAVNDPSKTTTVADMEEYIKKAYVTLLTFESAYKGSTLYKAEDPENNMKWNFGSSIFFSMNIYTTTGYGAIAPETNLGKVFVVGYGMIFVPLTLVVLRNLGQWILIMVTKIYAIMVFAWRKAKGESEWPENESISLPIKLSLLIVFGYYMFCVMFVYEFDSISYPKDSGLDFFHSLYFSFISITAVGLGDVMPNNITFNPIIPTLFLIGLAIIKVINRSTYIAIENGIFGAMTVLENRIEGVGEHKGPDAEKGIQGGKKVSDRKPSIPSKTLSKSMASASVEQADDQIPNEWINNFTVRSIATFMKSQQDVYGGDFGRVNLRKSDIVGNLTDAPHNRRQSIANTTDNGGPSSSSS